MAAISYINELEGRALAPPDNLRASLWSAKHRRLPDNSPCGNRWDNDRSPLLAITIDLAFEGWVREIALKKAVQVGGSEAFRCVIGFAAANDPSTTMLVLPNEAKGRKIVRKEYWPLFKKTPPLNELRTGVKSDFTRSNIRLVNNFELYLGWSGSADSLASFPCQRVFLDETDKFDEFAGKESPPIELARFRVTKFLNRSLIFALSTPTIDTAPISQLFDDSEIKLYGFVPCPHCGHEQILHQDNLRWEKYTDPDPAQRAKMVVAHKAAWFVCSHHDCQKRIFERDKAGMIKQAYLAPLDQSWKAYPDGRRVGNRPIGERVGIHYPAFYDLDVPWHVIAGEWIRAGHDHKKLMAVYNNRFAEAFKVQIASAKFDTFSNRCVPNVETGFVPAKARVVPRWASKLILIADTQKDYFFWTLRAWGYQRRSQRIAQGRAESFEHLTEIERSLWAYEADPLGQIELPPLSVFKTGIDTGGTVNEQTSASRTDEVYRWCNANPMMRIPLKGSSKPMDIPVRWRMVKYTPPGAKSSPYEVKLHLFDPDHFADLLMSGLQQRVTVDGDDPAAPYLWALNDDNDSEYNLHMSNMHKVLVKYRGAKVERWVPKTDASRHDYWDCEKMQFVLAVGMGLCVALQTEQQIISQHIQSTQMQQKKPNVSGIRTPDGRSFIARR